MQSDAVRSSDEELIVAAKAGDTAAFSELVRRHQHEVFTLAYRLVGDRDQAADVSQEAFVRAWRHLEKFRGDAKFSTWLHRITVNAAWSYRRKAKRHEAANLDDFVVSLPEVRSIEPDRAAESATMRPRLLQALNGLSPSVRSVVVLRDIYDWSHAQIAEHLDISVTATKVRLHRGHKQLKARLWDEYGSDG